MWTAPVQCSTLVHSWIGKLPIPSNPEQLEENQQFWWAEPNEHALPLFSETRLLRKKNLWRVTLISNLDLTTFQLGRTVICAPLYSIGLLGPYPTCASARKCMQMFQGHMKPAHNHICATVLRAMECIVSALLICLHDYKTSDPNALALLFREENENVKQYYGSVENFRKHVGQALKQV